MNETESSVYKRVGISFILVFAGLRAWFMNKFLFVLVWCLINSVYERVSICFILVFAGLRARFVNELLFSLVGCFQD